MMLRNLDIGEPPSKSAPIKGRSELTAVLRVISGREYGPGSLDNRGRVSFLFAVIIYNQLELIILDAIAGIATWLNPAWRLSVFARQ